jgi:FkbM family methyltransferase
MYSQNEEEKYIVEYFQNLPPVQRKRSLLDIGANDGKTFSNSLKLIEMGWEAALIEPSDAAFEKLCSLHAGNPNVLCLKFAIGNEVQTGVLHESGPHLPDKSDFSLLSTLKKEEKTRWKNVDFEEKHVIIIDYETLLTISTEFFDLRRTISFDFISIDAEGMDFEILQQIDLTFTKLLCIEHNSDQVLKNKIIDYCKNYGLNKIIYQNAENIIIGC